MQKIGIVGGGQLGRMLTVAAKPLGFDVIVIDPNEHAPAQQVGAEQITAPFRDSTAIRELAKKADTITIESEHVGVETLQELERAGKTVNPSSQTLGIIQDKLKQKQFLQAAGIPVAPFAEVTSQAQAEELLTEYGGRMVLKSRFNSFDGRGNWTIESSRELTDVLASHPNKRFYAEKVVPFQRELAVIGARSHSGGIVLYPLVETIHQRHICVAVLAPAPAAEAVADKAATLATSVLSGLDGAGVFAIEMFATKDNELLVNEVAPRVHNSGHFTLDACHTSQFEQHIRAVAGLPLGDPSMKVPAAVMVNILGARDGESQVSGLDRALQSPRTHVHLYGKSPTRVDRKMGHITATAETVEQAKKHAEAARQSLTV